MIILYVADAAVIINNLLYTQSILPSFLLTGANCICHDDVPISTLTLSVSFAADIRLVTESWTIKYKKKPAGRFWDSYCSPE